VPPRHPHLALVGCTASGKSALALAAARRLGDLGPPVEIVSVDSMQVYRGMDIGTAKASVAERAEVAHHLIDVVEPAEDFTVVRYQEAARSAIEAIEAAGHRALLVGGTGLWFRALVDDLRPAGQYPDVRAELESVADTAGLHRRLVALDPAAAAKIEPTNRRRVVRALEVTLGTGSPFSSFGPGMGVFPATMFRIAGIWLPRAVVSQRIDHRFDAMVAAGLVEEVRGLARRRGGMSATARQALGYREVLAHLEGGLPLDAALAGAARRTKAFARRQRMWWRRDPRITWFGAADNPFAALAALLGDWASA